MDLSRFAVKLSYFRLSGLFIPKYARLTFGCKRIFSLQIFGPLFLLEKCICEKRNNLVKFKKRYILLSVMLLLSGAMFISVYDSVKKKTITDFNAQQMLNAKLTSTFKHAGIVINE